MAPLAVGSVFVWNLKVGWKLWRWSPVRTDSSIKFRLDRLWIRFLDWAVPVVKHFVNTIKIASMSDLLALRFVSKKAPSKRLVPRWPWHYWNIAVRRIELLRWRSAADCCRCWAIFFFLVCFGLICRMSGLCHLLRVSTIWPIRRLLIYHRRLNGARLVAVVGNGGSPFVFIHH